MSDSLLSLARTTPIARAAVAELAGAAPVEELVRALSMAFDAGEMEAATPLALAIGVAGGRIPAPLALALLPDLESMDHLLMVAGVIEGDRAAALIDLAWGERLSWEREAIVLYLAARMAETFSPPPRLVARLRMLLREPLSAPAAIVAGLAAARVADDEVRALAGPLIPASETSGAKAVEDELWNRFDSATLDGLPERESPVFTGTVVRAEPKVGRNDPCPCGSGRKYKKCCEGKVVARPATRSVVDAFRGAGAAPSKVRQRRFEELRAADLERIDPAELTVLQVIQAMRKCATHRRWTAAERFAEELATRTDVPFDDAGGHRLDLADTALHAGELEVAERQMVLANPDERERQRFETRLALARQAPDALSRVETLLRVGHAEDQSLLVDIAFDLLRHSPALGILAARGAVSAERLLDAEMLLDEIGRARDVLNLPSIEPWWEIFDLLLEREADDGARNEEVETLQTRLRSAGDRSRALEEELRKRERQLNALSRERENFAAARNVESRPLSGGRAVVELEQERQRLRRKIEELKGEVTRGNEERSELRRQLARSSDERRREPPAAPIAGEPDTDDTEGEGVTSRPRHVLLPHYSGAMARALTSVPPRVAADALLAVARLAGGDVTVWSGAKHMRRAHEILTVRIGRAWRVLFRTSEERLEVLELVHRRELDQAIARLG